MNGHNVIAVYGSRTDAERARDRLIEIGIPGADIRMSAAQSGGPAGVSGMTPEPEAAPRREGFWDWLFGRDVPERDRGWYETNLREGRTVVSVLARDREQHQRIVDILEEFDPLDFDGGHAEGAETTLGAASGASGADILPADRMTGGRPLGAPEGWSRQPGASGAVPETAARPGVASAGTAQRAGDEVISVVKEELSVGKRASERRYRIRTYVVETPVEREVSLRDERVTIEHRPVSGAAATRNAEIPQEREYEVVERHEEPVVEKRARNVEEVVVHTDVNERTEKVRDNVRQTRVDVDNEAGGRADNLERAVPGRADPADRKR